MQFRRTRIPYTGRDKYFNGTGRKVKKSSILYGFGGNGGGNTIHPLQVNPSTAATADAEVTVPATNINASDLTIDSGITVTIPINGYADNELTEVWIGTTNSADTHYGISGMPANGMTVAVEDNGTDEPKLLVTFYSTITQSSGELLIPIQIKSHTYMENWGITQSSWDAMSRQNKTVQRVVSYTWNIKSAGGGSGYIFDLTNENASVNADVDGNIYSASVQSLQCQAILYYDNVAATGVSYTISVPTGTTGVSINQSTGVLSFNAQTFTFTGMATNITVTATKDNVTMTKVMHITKVKDGAGGASTSRWILPSVYSVVKAIDGTVAPSAVSATVMVQTAGNPPEVDTATTIFYGFAPDYINPTIPMPSTGITISDTVEYLVLALREGNVYNGTIYESETIPVISEGAGPAIRGPIRWLSSLARRFSNGVGPQQIDRNFIDIVRYNHHSYRCTTSYTQTSGQTWAQVSENWTLDDSYNFIASSVDLAQNEAIYIRPDNMIEFHNSQDGVVGRLTTSTMFYGASSYQNAPIKITNAGNIYGTNLNATGTIEGVTIKKNTGREYHYVAPFAPVEININFVHDDADKDDFIQNIGGVWCVNGNSTEISADEFPYLRVIDRNDEYHQDKLGWFMVSTSSEPVEDEEFVFTGVVDSSVQRLNNVMYITL